MDVIRKILFVLLCVVCISQSQSTFNYTQYSYAINDFKADSTKHTPAFSLTDFENLRVDVQLNDLDASGYASDSIKCFWWLEIGHWATDYQGNRYIKWSKSNKLVIDTFFVSSGNMAEPDISLQSDGSYNMPLKYVDTTTTLQGYASQSRGFTAPWDQLARVGIKGLTGNNVGSFLRCKIDVGRRQYQKVKDKDVD